MTYLNAITYKVNEFILNKNTNYNFYYKKRSKPLLGKSLVI